MTPFRGRGFRLCLVQRIKLLDDLRVFQFDDFAGEVVQGVFFRNIEEADPHGAQSLRFCPGTLVHLPVAVLDVTQHRFAKVGEMGADLVRPARDEPDLAEGKRPGGAQHIHIRDDLLPALVL